MAQAQAAGSMGTITAETYDTTTTAYQQPVHVSALLFSCGWCDQLQKKENKNRERLFF